VGSASHPLFWSSPKSRVYGLHFERQCVSRRLGVAAVRCQRVGSSAEQPCSPPCATYACRRFLPLLDYKTSAGKTGACTAHQVTLACCLRSHLTLDRPRRNPDVKIRAPRRHGVRSSCRLEDLQLLPAQLRAPRRTSHDRCAGFSQADHLQFIRLHYPKAPSHRQPQACRCA